MRAAAVAVGLPALPVVVLAQERPYLVHGRTCPRWLAHGLGALDATVLERQRQRQRQTDCLRHRLAMFGKEDGAWVVRCGFTWLGGRTFLSTPHSFDTPDQANPEHWR